MKSDFSNLTQEQLQFMAVLACVGEPIHIDLVGAVSPILPGKFLELLQPGKNQGWVQQVEKDKYLLCENLPKAAIEKIGKLNISDRIMKLIQMLQSKNLIDQISNAGLVKLYVAAGQDMDAALVERELAVKALKKRDSINAYTFLQSVAQRLEPVMDTLEAGKLYLSVVLDLSNLNYSLGKGTGKLPEMLKSSARIAERQGDMRSASLIDLHLGRLLHLSGRHVQALRVLSSGVKKVKELGDSDIHKKAAVFIGIYYAIQGRFKTAIDYFEQAMKIYQYSSDIVENPSAPILYGYYSTYLGRFNRAIGSLECNRHIAGERSDFGLAATLQATLGTVLTLIKNEQKARFHLNKAYRLARDTGNELALYLARGGLAYHYFSNGSIEKAHTIAHQAINSGRQAGFVFQYTSPWILEMIWEFHRKGYRFDGIVIQNELDKINQGENKQLKGVYFRLRATSGNGKKRRDDVLSDLNSSIELLKHSGDTIQTAKSWAAIAELEKKTGNLQGARRAARKAWMFFKGYGDVFFSRELSSLLTKAERTQNPGALRETFLKQALKIIEEIPPSEEEQVLFSCLTYATSRLFNTERGALISFEDQKIDRPIVKSGYCLMESQVKHGDFQERLKIIFRAFKTRYPVLIPDDSHGHPSGSGNTGTLVCLPIKLKNRLTAVLYHDNIYCKNSFGFLNLSILKHLSSHVSTCIDRYLDYGQVKEERNLLVSEKILKDEILNRDKLLAESRLMQTLLKGADQAAKSDSTVLILGETGVGKELLALRLHKKSHRKSGPYVVMDLTSIPENLLESELFGHEKGAFTGADQQKRGRIELADKGTLFFDEIGEISKNIQVKLLRAIQEKTFMRVGGTQMLSSDFRLVVATNRDLESEVATGRFRKDLYYRLNVIPIILPPLREREKDIILLAHHFIDTYAKKYGRRGIVLTPEHENILISYRWPGNIRELKNVIERAVILSSENRLEISLPVQKKTDFEHPFSDLPSMNEVQRRYICYVLEKTGNKLSGKEGADRVLDMKRQTLYARMKKLGLKA